MGTPGKSVRTPPNAIYEGLATYLPLVDEAVRRFARRLPRNVLRDDLVATATVGLLDALRRSPDRGPAFPYYARVRIEGAIVDGLRSQDWFGPSFRRRVRAGGESCSAAMIGFDDLPPAAALNLSDPMERSPEDELDLGRQRAALGSAVTRLPEREASIVTLHYFEGVELQDIAARLGVSGARVSQVHHRALAMMRAILDEPPGTDAARLRVDPGNACPLALGNGRVEPLRSRGQRRGGAPGRSERQVPSVRQGIR
jgi:RNA polymerase sigma factor FliA